MHVLVRESASLDETEAAAEDPGLAPADVLLLSFSDSDLTTAAIAWRALPPDRPSLRLANLARLRHPMSVDLFVEKTLAGTRGVVVRLLGGIDYWRYGCEQLHRYCRDHGIPLAIVAGDGRPDRQLIGVSTVDPEDLAGLEALLDAGGPANFAAALNGLNARANGSAASLPAPEAMPEFGVYDLAVIAPVTPAARAAIIFYRASVHAGDTAPIDALAQALALLGVAATALFVPSLKAPDAARWLRETLVSLAPGVILNATAFSARDGANSSPLDAANCPVLQVITAITSEAAWAASPRGLGAADLAMHVALPELDGRIDAGVISFKQAAEFDDGLGFSPVLHAPHREGIAHAASLAANWARLRRKPAGGRSVALMLSTYPGRSDQIAHAVGLDGPESAAEILRRLDGAGYDLGPHPKSGRALLDLIQSGDDIRWPLVDYAGAFAVLPQSFRDAVTSAWGEPDQDPDCSDGSFRLRVRGCGRSFIVLQPERGAVADRKAGYHDPAMPPRHAYIACYLWLRDVARIHALIHLGAHGTLEWLPGKSAALSAGCAPRALIGATPVIYPFIVNDPGEAAQAKRRIGAVTLGHKTPPLIQTGLEGKLRELEQLVDEFSAADGLDPRRRTNLAAAISDAADRAGVAQACGLTPDLDSVAKLARIDAFLCDVKEMTILDGLHILDEGECDALLHALEGSFIEPGPSGAPSRGRADVLPTGRNLYTIDPRGIPTPSATGNGTRAARAIQDRYAEAHGDWPRSIVLDLWGSATLRTGGEELATAYALLGVKPAWDSRSFRVSGFEVIPAPLLDRPRVDVTLRISGLFRDMFGAQLALFHAAVQRVASLREDREMNPLLASYRTGVPLERIFGASSGSFGAGVMALIDGGDWRDAADLGQAYLAQSSTAHDGTSEGRAARQEFTERVQSADAFVHIQDHREIDLLTGGDFAAHEGGFAAAAAALGNTRVALYHGDTGEPGTPKIRTLDEECARVVAGRGANPVWIAGQMRHGFRGAAELAATVDAAFAFAATSGAITSAAFDALFDAYLLDPVVSAFLARENPAALAAIRVRFDEAVARRLWTPRRNDLSALHAAAEMEAAQ